uniref:Protein of unassigned function n=1 Tax=Parastrongyloides trichosuri TaxID=131310 RepID=A0A0N4ZIX2_PARTI
MRCPGPLGDGGHDPRRQRRLGSGQGRAGAGQRPDHARGRPHPGRKGHHRPAGHPGQCGRGDGVIFRMGPEPPRLLLDAGRGAVAPQDHHRD